MSVSATPVQASWNGGELSPLMQGRVDTAIYPIGAALMENFVPAIEGPVQKCPGFRRIRAAAASATWLMPFTFNTTQSYVIEGSEQVARFYTNGGRIESAPDDPYELAVPYAAAEWPRVSRQQSGDRLYLAHGSHAPAALTRTSAVTFDHAPLVLERGPFEDGNTDEAVTVAVTGDLQAGGAVTLTASAPLFVAGHVGSPVQIEAIDYASVPAWEVGLDGIVVGTTRRSDGKVYLAASAGRTGTIAPIHDEGTAWDGDGTGKDINGKGPYGVQWTYLHDRFGIVRIDAVTSATEASATVVRRVPDGVDTTPTWRWALGAFNEADGWPEHVFVWAGRLCFLKGRSFFASVVGDYLNHQAYTSSGYLADDLAIRLVLAIPDVPLWVKVDRVVVFGTASGEYIIGPVNAGAGVTAANIQCVKQSHYGSAPVEPVEAGAALVFVQRGGTQLREAQYDFGRDRYVSPNMNRWARHVLAPGLIQTGQQQQTEELLFGVRGDGQLVFRTYDPEQETKGFARRVLAGGGTVLSAVCIPNEDGSRDDIWALCRWGDALSVQRMADWWKPAAPGYASDRDPLLDAYFVDDGAQDEIEVASPTVSGLDWLVGIEVAILADGAVEPRQVVPASGTITLTRPASVRVVGRPYTARFRPMVPEVRDPTGQSSTGKIKRIVQMVLRVIETSGVKLDMGSGRFETLLERPTSAKMDRPQPLFTGDTEPASVGGEFDRFGSYTVISDDPRPCFVAAAVPRIQVSDK